MTTPRPVAKRARRREPATTLPAVASAIPRQWCAASEIAMKRPRTTTKGFSLAKRATAAAAPVGAAIADGSKYRRVSTAAKAGNTSDQKRRVTRSRSRPAGAITVVDMILVARARERLALVVARRSGHLTALELVEIDEDGHARADGAAGRPLLAVGIVRVAVVERRGQQELVLARNGIDREELGRTVRDHGAARSTDVVGAQELIGVRELLRVARLADAELEEIVGVDAVHDLGAVIHDRGARRVGRTRRVPVAPVQRRRAEDRDVAGLGGRRPVDLGHAHDGAIAERAEAQPHLGVARRVD